MKKHFMITEEMQAAIIRLKKGEAIDNNGIRVEDIKNCDIATKVTMKQIFNEVLKQKKDVLQKHCAEYG